MKKLISMVIVTSLMCSATMAFANGIETEEETASRHWMLYSAIKGHCIVLCLPFRLSLLVWIAQKRGPKR